MPAAPRLTIYRDSDLGGGSGDGPAVVLFHGFPDTAHSWDSIADELEADGRRVIVPHLRGYDPDSIDPARGYGAKELAEDAISVLDDHDLDSAVLVGHDWGATLAYGAASLAPERVTALVACAIPHPRTVKPDPRLAWKVRHFLTLRLPLADKVFALRNFAAVDTLYRRWAPGWSGPERDACIAQVKAAFSHDDVLDAALGYYRDLSPRPPREVNGKISQPTLVVGGTRDLLPPEAFQRSVSAFTGHVEVAILDGAGHWPQREREQQFLDRLRTFLDVHA